MNYISKLNGIKFVNNTLNVSVFSYINPSIGASDGVATLLVTGGRSPYKYSIDNGKTFQESNVITGLPTGINIFMVKDVFNNLGWCSVRMVENVDCGTLSGNTWNDTFINTWEELYNCTWEDFE